MLRIVLIVHHFPPDVNSTGRLMSRVKSELRKAGHDVAVITTFPHYERFRIWPDYRRKLVQRERLDGGDVWRVWCFAPGRKSMRNRLMNYVTFNLMATVVGLGVIPRSDVVLVTNGSFFTGLTAWICGAAARVRGRRPVPFVYNVQDLYPQVPVQAGQLRRPVAISVLQQVARFMYRKAASVAVITPSFRDYIHENDGIPLEKIEVVPNFVDTEVIRPHPRESEYSSAMGFSGRFVVAHSGNLGYVYDLFTLLEAAVKLAEHPDILVVIIGDGVLKAKLVERASDLQLTNVRFLEFQADDDLPWLRASTDVQLALYVPGAARHSMPSKVYEIMASERPILASAEAGSDVHRLVEESGAGICVGPEDPGALAAAILRLRARPDERAAMGQSGRAYVVRHHSVNSSVSAYNRLLVQVAAPTGGHSG